LKWNSSVTGARIRPVISYFQNVNTPTRTINLVEWTDRPDTVTVVENTGFRDAFFSEGGEGDLREPPEAGDDEEQPLKR
jgi:hypothetical protein